MTEVIRTDCVVIGGGIAGISIARKLSSVLDDLVLIERDPFFGNSSTSRNSEVIHAGIYYKPGSMKNQLVSIGKNKLYKYLIKRNIPFKKVGKYIISTESYETQALNNIKKNAFKCGLDDLFFDSSNFKKRYPYIKVDEALFSPSTGIFDSHTFVQCLLADFEKCGGYILKNYNFQAIEAIGKNQLILLNDMNSREEYRVEARLVINCAGHNAVDIYNMFPGDGPIYNNRYVKGDYYSYHGKERIDHLIYPVPQKDGLGVHVTMDLDNQIRFGPSSYEVKNINYEINSEGKSLFMQSIKKYWPFVDESLVSPSYSGIRSKLVGIDDFVINKKEVENNMMISILGYDSPGLTASLGLAEYVYDMCYEASVLKN